jgi:hypothetical protein
LEKYSKKYKNTKIQNTKIKKIQNTKIKKIQNTKIKKQGNSCFLFYSKE